jgi:SCY1-like protein 2
MDVIRKLGERVEKEHNQFLRDSQRLEDRSANAAADGAASTGFANNVDFQNLVGRSNGATVKADTVIDNSKGWDDDVWGSIFTEARARFATRSTSTDRLFVVVSCSRTRQSRLRPSP